ncbi:MAG TPA: 50S ribosomal protein L25 [Candidatus Elarobacter sp.]|jgi:large subunit ribosomal protein L25|nr:50S ribosomal protein L25 [Candidatus Elarobacter sp.]
MSNKHNLSSLTLEPRDAIGTTKAHALRRAGKIPGVVYGHGESTPITVDAKELVELILSGHKSHIVEAKIGKKRDSVLLRRIDSDPITRKPLSVDFQRVKSGEAITASVQVAVTGTPVGVRDQGGVMDLVTHALDIKGPAQSIPDNLTVDVSELTVHSHVTAGQVTLPKGFTLLTPPETVVVSVEITRAAAGEEIEETPPTLVEAPPAE